MINKQCGYNFTRVHILKRKISLAIFFSHKLFVGLDWSHFLSQIFVFFCDTNVHLLIIRALIKRLSENNSIITTACTHTVVHTTGVIMR